jgi:hypothetical protein
MKLSLAEMPNIIKRLRNGGVTVSLSPNSPNGVVLSGDAGRVEKAKRLLSPIMAEFVSLLAEWGEIERMHQASADALVILKGFEARGVSFRVSALGELSVSGNRELIASLKGEIKHQKGAIIAAWFERDEREAIQAEANGGDTE